MNIYTYMESPVGKLMLVSNGDSLTGLYFAGENTRSFEAQYWTEDQNLNLFVEVRSQLDEYFNGFRTNFNLPIITSGTPFQQSVWEFLLKIPYGETVSYKEIAQTINRPGSFRAVGQANGNNPISIIIPCHRVIGTNGSLTGYGGGILIKAALLNFEKEVCTNGPHKLASMPAYDHELLKQS